MEPLGFRHGSCRGLQHLLLSSHLEAADKEKARRATLSEASNQLVMVPLERPLRFVWLVEPSSGSISLPRPRLLTPAATGGQIIPIARRRYKEASFKVGQPWEGAHCSRAEVSCVTPWRRISRSLAAFRKAPQGATGSAKARPGSSRASESSPRILQRSTGRDPLSCANLE